MRLLVDEHGLAWREAWPITRGSIAYTNHTLLPEALESWPVPLMERLLLHHADHPAPGRHLREALSDQDIDRGAVR